ncbi:hypothetical protein BJ741DRAFT_589494 [Chytriomyces cf. hyalinus JEL632]|nr:hypothetical protein BJ741DRAFT_589494 [Chytriomyces cf. hyalinus JEL632]
MPSPAELQTLVLVYAVLAAITAVQTLMLLKLVLFDEKRKRESTLMGHIINPFNVCLLVMPIANCIIYVGTMLSLSSADPVVKLQFTIAADFGVAMFQLGCVHYTWCRGLPIIEISVPGALPWLRCLVAISPVLFGMLPIPDLMLLNNIHVEFAQPASKAVGVLCGSVVFVFDVAVLTVFVRYLKRGLTLMIQEDVRLRIIARYGIATVGVGGVSLVLVAVANTLDDTDGRYAFAFQTLQLTVFGLFSVIHSILFAMKVALLSKSPVRNTSKSTVAASKTTTMLTVTASPSLV